MFIVGTQGDDVNEYTLSTAFDVSSATHVDTFGVPGNPTAIKFNGDGTKMYVVGVESVLKQYTLSTGFDLSSTITGPVSVNLTDTDDDVFGLDFNNDGTKVFIAGNENDSIYSFTLSTGFDLSTFDVSSKVTLDVGPSPGPGYDHEPFGIEFSPDGTRMFVVGTADNGVDEYTCLLYTSPSPRDIR